MRVSALRLQSGSTSSNVPGTDYANILAPFPPERRVQSITTPPPTVSALFRAYLFSRHFSPAVHSPVPPLSRDSPRRLLSIHPSGVYLSASPLHAPVPIPRSRFLSSPGDRASVRKLSFKDRMQLARGKKATRRFYGNQGRAGGSGRKGTKGDGEGAS